MNDIYNFDPTDNDDIILLLKDRRCFLFMEKIAEVYRSSFFEFNTARMLNSIISDFPDIIGSYIFDTQGLFPLDEYKIDDYIDKNYDEFMKFRKKIRINPRLGRYFILLFSQRISDGGHFFVCIFDFKDNIVYINDSMVHSTEYIYHRVLSQIVEMPSEMEIVISRSFIRQPTGGFQQDAGVEYEMNDQHHFCYMESILFVCEFLIYQIYHESMPVINPWHQTKDDAWMNSLIVIKRFFSQIMAKWGDINKEAIVHAFGKPYPVSQVVDGFRYICVNNSPIKINTLNLTRAHMNKKSILDIVRDSYKGF